MLWARLETLWPHAHVGTIRAVITIRASRETVEVPTNAFAIRHPGHHPFEFTGKLATLSRALASAFAGRRAWNRRRRGRHTAALSAKLSLQSLAATG